MKFVSFNVNGLNGPVKRKRVLTHLKKLRIDIAFIQETHLTAQEHKKLKRDWVGHVLSSSFTSRARGVAILINKNTPVTIGETIIDPSGRYVLVHCQIYSEPWTLLNLYAPNYDDESFIQDIFLKVSGGRQNILVGGDFNFCLDPVMDKSTSTVSKTKAAKTTLAFMEDLNLTDVWRHAHPQTRDYSFYSCPHNSHTRIDLFLLSSHLIHRTLDSEYLSRTLSDHSPLTLSIFMPEKPVNMYRWRMNPALLKRPDFCKFIRDCIELFCETNCPSSPNSFILWDTLKAFLRGHIISYTKGVKKKYMAEIEELETEILRLEKEFQQSGSEELYKLLVNKKLEYNMLDTYKIEKVISRTKQRYYELGEKAHKILSWQLKTEDSSRTINSIQTNTGTVSYNPTEINDTFKEFYTKLYTSESPEDLNKIDEFLSTIELPTLSQEDQNNLDLPFTQKEIEKALSLLQSNKSPGEDGFPPEFYREFKDLLIPLIKDVLDLASRTQTLPESFSTAIITVIHKKNKDPLKCASYRPISLLNTDYKLISKVLANRLGQYLPQLINPDQSGFILKRSSSNNLCRLFNIIHLAKSKTEPSIAVALDAEKAFDRLEWPFLFKVLAKYGFGQSFINWVKTLYHMPRARITTNGQISAVFPLSRSSRQGCPLSPGLFVLAIEPLAEAIRQDPDIKGFKVGQTTHKLNLMADDVILYLTDPGNSLAKLQTLLDTYSVISGYKVNMEKSEIIPLTNFDYTECQQASPFKWLPNGIKYLGITVDNDLNNLYKLNYLPLLTRIEEDLSRWMSLPITLCGRVNCVKMNVLPRLQYLFQSLPIPLPQTFFKTLNKHVRQFIWNCKVPRVSMVKLTWDYRMGGLRLPSFKKYYLAAQMRFISSFFEGESAPSWIQIGVHTLKEDVFGDFIYKWSPKMISKKTDNPILRHLVKIWWETHGSLGLNVGLSPRTPLRQNGLIPMTLNNKILATWYQKGIHHLEDCYDGVLMSFEQLKRKYDLSDKTFYCYLQLRSFLREGLGPGLSLPLLTDVEELLHGDKCRFISRMYSLLLNGSPKPGVHKSRMRWETDLGITIDEQLWSDLCQDSMSATINARYRLVHYNFLHQLYLTPQKIHKSKPELSEMCFRCGVEVGSFLHCTWLCTKVRPFWFDFCDTMTKVTGVTFPLDPELCLLGNLTSISRFLPKSQIKFVEIALCVARKCLTVTWKSDSYLHIDRWSSEINSCIPLEKITYSLRKGYGTFLKIWQPYLEFIDASPTAP